MVTKLTLQDVKPGDMVRFVEEYGYATMTLKKVYEVEAVTDEYIRVRNDKGISADWYAFRFELVTPKKPIDVSHIKVTDFELKTHKRKVK